MSDPTGATPPPPDDLNARVRVVERELARLSAQVAAYAHDAQTARSDASSARILAAGAHRDVADVAHQLRAHTQVLNALRETQLEQGDRIDALSSRMDGGFARLSAGMEGITSLLNQLIERDQ